MMRALSIALAFWLPQLALAQEMGGATRDLTRVGFQAFEEVSRVFVETTDPAVIRVEDKGNKVIVVLENTTCTVENNLRFLDTQYFDSPVRLISPSLIEGASPSVQIEIFLRDRVPYEETRRDGYFALDFQR